MECEQIHCLSPLQSSNIYQRLAWTKSINAYGISGSAYSSNGYKTCAGYPGAYGHELQDLETWRSWGWTELVKYDNCYIPYDNITMENEYGRYRRMLDAITTLAAKYDEKPFIYSICQWGWENPQNWAPRISNAWRIDADIRPFWANIAAILNLASTTYGVTDHYQHGDLDIMEVGNSGQGSPPGDMTYYEQRTHFTAWALLKSHLIIGTDLRNASNETLEILLNKELIAINQDPNEGAALAPFRIGIQPDFSTITYNDTYPPAYWAGNSSYGAVFMIINTLDEPQTMFFDLTENWAVRAGRQYTVRDMWAHEDVGIAVRNWTVNLQAHDVAALLLTDAGPEPAGLELPCASPFLEWQCTSPNGSYILDGTHVEWGF
jgi:alpha-galactosidase